MLGRFFKKGEEKRDDFECMPEQLLESLSARIKEMEERMDSMSEALSSLEEKFDDAILRLGAMEKGLLKTKTIMADDKAEPKMWASVVALLS